MLPFPAGKGSRVVASRLSLHSVLAWLHVKVLMAGSGRSKTSSMPRPQRFKKSVGGDVHFLVSNDILC